MTKTKEPINQNNIYYIKDSKIHKYIDAFKKKRPYICIWNNKNFAIIFPFTTKKQKKNFHKQEKIRIPDEVHDFVKKDSYINITEPIVCLRTLIYINCIEPKIKLLNYIKNLKLIKKPEIIEKMKKLKNKYVFDL